MGRYAATDYHHRNTIASGPPFLRVSCKYAPHTLKTRWTDLCFHRRDEEKKGGDDGGDCATVAACAAHTHHILYINTSFKGEGGRR